MTRAFWAILLLAFCHGAAAQAAGEIGVRYWLSTGQTENSHNAQAASPALGNPTSILTYDNLDAHVAEIYGRVNFAGDWFLKGNLGIGRINTGNFDDEDYFAGQLKFLDTTSSVAEGKLAYGTVDLGVRQWTFAGGRSSAGLFLGYNHWMEDVDAYGLTRTVDTLGLSSDLPSSVLVLSNKATWKSLRLGIAANFALGERAQLVADLAYVPYSKVRNEDSHHLRPDLGPVPNVIKEGVGTGVQLDLELRYAIWPRTLLGLGFRYWRLEADHGADNGEFPIVDLISERLGATFSITYAW